MQEMMSYFNVLGPRVLDRIFRDVYCTRIITQYKYMFKIDIKIIQLLFHIKDLCTTTTSGDVLGFGRRKCNVIFLFAMPRNKGMT